MGTLFTSLVSSANALGVIDRQMAAIQNNVTNSSTPGYVKQTQTVQAMAFDPAGGLVGGVKAGPVVSARSEYAEEAVRRQNTLWGGADQRKVDFSQLETLFDTSGKSGLPAALSALFSSFSQLSVDPNDSVGRQDVLDKATAVVEQFHETAAGLTTVSTNADQQISSTISRINDLCAHIAQRNAALKADFRTGTDAGMDADLHAGLEQLSEYADVTVLQDEKGQFNVYLGGHTPLVVGDRTFNLSVENGKVLDSSGQDISGKLSTGRLGALIGEKKDIASYTFDLHRLASAFASTINTTLTGGTQKDGVSAGLPMFQFIGSESAANLSLTGITADQIAAASPAGSNANALSLAALSTSNSIDGASFAGFFGALGSRIGHALSDAQNEASNRESLLSQARSLREDVSAVSLDEEAALLMQLQRQYQAVGKLVGVLNDLTESVLAMVR